MHSLRPLAVLCFAAYLSAQSGAATAAAAIDAVHPLTDGEIAFGNLQSQIAGVESLLERQPASLANLTALAELVGERGRVSGALADYERVSELAERAVRTFPQAPAAYALRAKANAIFHDFDAALADVDRAEKLGHSRIACEKQRAGIYQGTGRFEEALAIRRRQVEAHADLASRSALASLHAERGEIDTAAALFASALANYRDVSPFPVAALRYDEGRMWMQLGEWDRARAALAEAHRILPSYAAAQGHLAEVEAELGNRARAIALLLPLAEQSSDPDYAAQLARIANDDGRPDLAEKYRRRAALGFDALMTIHAAAFADHATDFWLAAGKDAGKALQYAELNLRVRRTPRSYELAIDAARRANPSRVLPLCREAAAAQAYSVALRAACA